MPRPEVLIVEKDAAVARALEFWLRDSGIEAVVVDTGEAAVRSVSAGRLSAVVADVQLPGMDGAEVTRRVKREVPHRHLPVFLMSAGKQPPPNEADGVFEKPRQLTQLVDAVIGACRSAFCP